MQSPRGRLDGLVALFVLAMVCAVNYMPYAYNPSFWGHVDWVLHASWAMAARESLLRFGQLPFWDPYFCGGVSLLDFPETMMFSPFFAPLLTFGLIGIRIAAYLSTLAGMYGFYLLCRHYGLGAASSYLPPIIFFLNTQYQNRLQFGGFSVVFTLAFVPWVLLAYLKAQDNVRFLPVASLALALMTVSGSPVFPVQMVMLLLAYSMFLSLSRRDARPIALFALIALPALALAAAKLVPGYLFMQSYPRDFGAYVEGYSLRMMWSAAFEKPAAEYIFYYHFPEEKWHWHEYTAYVGVLPVLLALAAFKSNRPEKWVLAGVTLLFLLLSMGHQMPGFSLWDSLRSLPVISSGRVPERFINMAYVGLSLLAGLGLTQIEKKSRSLAALFLAFILFDLLMASHVVVAMTYDIPPENQMIYGKARQDVFYQEVSRVGSLSAVLLNIGDAKCYTGFPGLASSNVTPKYVNGVPNGGYRGEAYLLNGRGSVKLVRVTPNAVEVEVSAAGEDTLVLNQNYYPGWGVRGASGGAAYPYNGLVAADVSPADGRVTFSFLPERFLAGAAVSLVSLAAYACLLIPAVRLKASSSLGRLLSRVSRLNRVFGTLGTVFSHPPLSLLAERRKAAALLVVASAALYLLHAAYIEYAFDPLRPLPSGGLSLIDSIDVGNSFDEGGHAYESRTCGNASYATYSYPDGRVVTDSGRSCGTGIETFSVGSVPGRDLYVVKRLDYALLDQGVKVSVYTAAGGWGQPVAYPRFAGNDPEHRWRDVWFVIPGRYVTSNRTRIQVAWGSGASMNSYHYWIYA